jgi:DNA helicase-2/ATP-dependent DNA helicase PcrA
MQKWQAKVATTSAADIIQGILAESGYVDELKAQSNDEANDRIANLQELYNAALQFAEENEDASLDAFLANAALASSLDDNKESSEKVALMTLHAAKGLEFPVVFLVGLEEGLFPSFRSVNDPSALEEERRLMYVGITRAQEKLFLSHAQARRLYGNREYAIPSRFLAELPKEYLTGHGIDKFISKASQRAEATSVKGSLRSVAPVKASAVKPKPRVDWQVGDRVKHEKFGEGQISNLLGTGDKMYLAVAFAGQGKKIIDPKIAPIQKL